MTELKLVLDVETLGEPFKSLDKLMDKSHLHLGD